MRDLIVLFLHLVSTVARMSRAGVSAIKLTWCSAANLRVLEINEIKTVPYVPLSHPFIERLIGTIRREFLDHVPFWGDRDLDRKLESFREYYNHARCHQSLGGRAPDPPEFNRSQPFAKPSNCEGKSTCRGLYQLPIAA